MVRTYTEIDTRVRDPVQIKEEYSNAIGKELAPNMAEKARVALTVDPYSFFMFHRIRVGRRCSCWDVETSPEGLCEVCYGKGVVGGFEKWGCKTEVLDVTYQNVRTVNILPDYESQLRPTPFILLPSATKGYIEADISILQNTGVLDYLDLVSHAPKGSTVNAFIRTMAEVNFVPLNRANLQARLSTTRIIVRIVLARSSPSAGQPTVSNLMLRYRMRDTITVNADIPKRTESILLADLGIMDNFASLTMVFDSTLSRIGTEDFLVYLDKFGHPKYRFKIIEVTKFEPFETDVGWEVQARFAHDYESYSRFPAESIDYIDDAELTPIYIEPFIIETFVATPATIEEGSSSVLSWTTTGAVSVDIDNGVGTGLDPDGSITVTPLITTTYTLTAYSANGDSITRKVTVTVTGVSVLQLWAWGMPVTLTTTAFAWVDDSRILASIT